MSRKSNRQLPFSSIFKKYHTKDVSELVLSPDDKTWIADLIITDGTSVLQLCARYSLKPRTVYRWVQDRLLGRSFQNIRGTLPTLDAQAHSEISEQLAKSKVRQKCVGEEQFEDLIQNKQIETSLRRGGPGLKRPINKKFAKHMLAILHAGAVQGQKKTEARIRAESEDDYQIQLRNDGKGVERLVVLRDSNDSSPPTTQGSEQGHMGFSIKSRVLASPSGALGPMVLIVADSELRPNLMVVLKINGLNFSASDPTRPGFLVIQQSRTTDIDFNIWYFNDVLVPYFKELRGSFSGEELRTIFLTTDGEQKNIEAMMQEKSLQLMSDQQIIVGKHSASMSARGNDLDAGNLFKATKKKIKHMRQSFVESNAPVLKRALISALMSENCSESILSTNRSKREQLAEGICRIVIACQQVMSPSLVQGGFEATGRWGMHGFDLDARLRASSYQWTAAQILLVKRELPSLVVIMRHQGHIKETQLDEASIPKGEPDHEKAPKDERPLNKQRVCILSTDDQIARHDIMLEARLAKSPAAVAERKKAADELKKRAAEEKAAQKAEKRLDKEIASLDEAWWSLKSAEEIAAENAEPVAVVMPEVASAASQKPKAEKRKASNKNEQSNPSKKLTFGPPYIPRVRKP